MSRLGGWLRSVKLDDGDPAAEAKKERDNLIEAMSHANLIMNDDIDGAYTLLKSGSSSFHRLGAVVTFFMRSVLGMEKSVMAETTSKLDECENKSWDEFKAAQRRGDREGSVYPAGTEYELVRAQAQLMGAVVGVLHESLVEAMKSFYKLRKAYLTLSGIIASESKAAEGKSDTVVKGQPVARERMPGSFDESDETGNNTPRNEPEIFVDAKEAQSGTQTPANATDLTEKPLELKSEDTEEFIFTDPIDIFIHSGTNACFGILTLILTLVPPSFSRILSIVGFTGDRAKGVHMLWRSSQYDNVNGAISGMVLLAYYNGLLATVDILPHPSDYDDAAETVGPPREKCDALLATMRKRYPDSRLWRVEEARAYTSDRNLTKAISVLTTGTSSKMKQVTALNDFELALDAMMAQDWPLMRDTFLRCLENNDWSPAMYYFMAGCACLELYRNAYHAGDVDEARRQKGKADGYLRKAPTVAGAKKFMAKKLPFEVFLQMKVKRWEERAVELKVDLVDAVGASPAMELCYMWNGTKRMGTTELEKAVKCCAWERCTDERVAEKLKGEEDEVAVWAVCLAAVRRRQGLLDQARILLENVTKHPNTVFKGHLKNDYVAPATAYELGAIAWDECCDPPENEENIAAYRKKKMEECEAQLEKVKAWEAFVLDVRIGLRVQSGLETLKWFKGKMGWA